MSIVGQQLYLGNDPINLIQNNKIVLSNPFTYEEPAMGYVTDGLIWYVDADDTNSYPGTGTAVYDISGQDLEASLQNGASYSAVSSSFSFDGTNDLLRTTGSFSVSLSEKTLLAWVKLDNISQTGGGVIGVQGPSTVFDTITYNETSQGWGYGSDFFNRTFWTGVTETSTQDWVMITGVYASGTNGYKMYRQDQLIGQGTESVYSFSTGVYYQMGVRVVGFSTYLDGYIPVGMVYNRALTADEITQNYNYFKGRFGL